MNRPKSAPPIQNDKKHKQHTTKLNLKVKIARTGRIGRRFSHVGRWGVHRAIVDSRGGGSSSCTIGKVLHPMGGHFAIQVGQGVKRLEHGWNIELPFFLVFYFCKTLTLTLPNSCKVYWQVWSNICLLYVFDKAQVIISQDKHTITFKFQPFFKILLYYYCLIYSTSVIMVILQLQVKTGTKTLL